jgi:hypothetical protein
MQVVPLQQPWAQLVPSHPPPSADWHTPLLQLSPVVHPAQVAPLVPHCDVDWFPQSTQVVPLQQPLAQLEALHPPPDWQVPFWHVVPPPHETHAAPAVPVPQEELVWVVGVRQVLPLQQPLEQVVALQLPALFKHAPKASQVWLPLQPTQAAPLRPQALLAVEPTPGF